jgi:hypothetical protein
MTATDFAALLYQLLGTAAPRSILTAPVAVMVNNADSHRPSTAVIEFEALPPFTLMVSKLRAPYEGYARDTCKMLSLQVVQWIAMEASKKGVA